MQVAFIMIINKCAPLHDLKLTEKNTKHGFFKHILKALFSTCTFPKAQVNRSVASYFRKSMIDPIYSTEAKNTPTSLFPQKEITNFTK